MNAQKPYVLSFLGSMAIASAILIFMYASTFLSPVHGAVTSAVLFIIIGLTMAMFMVGLHFEPFNLSRLGTAIIWTGVSVVAIFIVNRTVPPIIDVSPLSSKMFAVLMGVAEECFFRVWLCTWINKITNQAWLAIGVSSFAWSLYHINRYGGNFNILMIIFACGCILGAVILYSKMADAVIFGHAIINYLAVV